MRGPWPRPTPSPLHPSRLPSSRSGAFDFLYLPVDFRTSSGLGYAFINFTSSRAAARLYRAFHHKRWDEQKSQKVSWRWVVPAE